jgi:nicotinate phosphoribosyltransferase
MEQTLRQVAEGALFTDMYQLTMAQLYFRAGLHERKAQFDHYFRRYPDYGEHQAGYCISAGMGWLVDWMLETRFGERDLEYLKAETGPDGRRVFGDDFLDFLRRDGNFEGLTLTGVPEGRVVHAEVPLTVVEGPLAMAQILETPLLNTLNYQTLIATKAARIRHSVGSNLLLEFGLRRGHGKGAIEGARAALIGGCDFTSNSGVSYAMGLSPKGTHSHAMVQAWIALGGTELDAFRAYAEVYPDNCLLLVDTVDTLASGVPNAIRIFEELKRQGHRPIGIRLDSGDLAYLAIQAARMLDEAGFPETTIVLSNELDELTIWQIHAQIREEAARYSVEPEALIRRLTYGVGTRLITSEGQPALGGVFKLVAIEKAGQWSPAIKLSESISKIPNPGHKLAWRLYDNRGQATADLVGLSDEHPERMETLVAHHPTEKGVFRILDREDLSEIEPLLKPILVQGRRMEPQPGLDEMRQIRRRDLERLDPGVRRLRNPHIYHVSLTSKLLKLKQDLIRSFRGSSLPGPADQPVG